MVFTVLKKIKEGIKESLKFRPKQKQKKKISNILHIT